MSSEYRVTLPELIGEYDPQIHKDILRSVRTILWRGDASPDQSIIDTIMEGQCERMRSMPIRSADYVNIEKRRRFKLGWYVIDRINIPGA